MKENPTVEDCVNMAWNAAMRVDFLTSKEIAMYAKALFAAMEWGWIEHEPNKEECNE